MFSMTHCMRCGGEAGTVIENDTLLCGNCFLGEALRRRRRLSPATRWRMRRERMPGTPARNFETAVLR